MTNYACFAVMGCFRGESLRFREEVVMVTTPPEGGEEGEFVHNVPRAVGYTCSLSHRVEAGSTDRGVGRLPALVEGDNGIPF